MNPLSLITAALSLVSTVAPYVPHLVQDAETFVPAVKKAAADIAKLDVKASIGDVSAILSSAGVEVTDLTQILSASKAIAVA